MTTNSSEHSKDYIDLKELFLALYKGKWIVFNITLLASILVVIYSLSLPNIYQSTSLILPKSNAYDANGAMKSYGSLARIAGIELPTNADPNPFKAIKKIDSLSFFESNIMPNIFLPQLMAYDSWDAETNKDYYKDDIYNIKDNLWVRSYSFPQKLIPSAQESYEHFKKHHISITEDITGFVSVKVKHQSPYIANEWNRLLIDEINSYFRQLDKIEAEKTIAFLNSQINQTQLAEIKEVIALLLKQEIQKLSLVEANEFYVYEYIDASAVMEMKLEPKRSIICIIGAFIGAIIGIFIVLIRYYFFRNPEANIGQ